MLWYSCQSPSPRAACFPGLPSLPTKLPFVLWASIYISSSGPRSIWWSFHSHPPQAPFVYPALYPSHTLHIFFLWLPLAYPFRPLWERLLLLQSLPDFLWAIPETSLCFSGSAYTLPILTLIGFIVMACFIVCCSHPRAKRAETGCLLSSSEHPEAYLAHQSALTTIVNLLSWQHRHFLGGFSTTFSFKRWQMRDERISSKKANVTPASKRQVPVRASVLTGPRLHQHASLPLARCSCIQV